METEKKITTKQGKATRAYIALANMSSKVLPANAALRLFKLKKALKDAFDFETEQEKLYVAELGGEMDQNGIIKFKDPIGDNKIFQDRRKELEDTDIEIELEVPTVALTEIKELSMADLEALEGFVNFK